MTENTEPQTATDDIGPDPSLLLVDDDAPFLRRLARAMETRGFAVDTAESVAEQLAARGARPWQTDLLADPLATALRSAEKA